MQPPAQLVRVVLDLLAAPARDHHSGRGDACEPGETEQLPVAALHQGRIS
jgi:hypothetical protein